MRIQAIPVAALLLTAILASPLPAAAQVAPPMVGGVVSSAPGQQIVVMQPSFAEVALESCAGGAAIGFLAVVAFGGASPGSTAALFCGLSVAATTASAVTAWTWRAATSPFR